MKTENAEVVNKLGIHARPAAKIVKAASIFYCDITLTADGDTVNAKSIMGVMTLAACRGTTIEVTAEGDDENEAVKTIVDIIRGGFGEE
ncbi:MAG: HPr family phosphocarrier protein [Candidatus Aegiribacteria sp.]|nr:HPr family phosphocarrier protein [Candidatus Aegiribacteria sp.]